MNKETSFDDSILRILNNLDSPPLAAARERLMKEINKKPKPVSIGVDELTGREIKINF